MSRLARWILSLLSLSACSAGAQVGNFDDVPDGTDISTHYPGLTFSCEGAHCVSSSVFARQTLDPTSPPNTVALGQIGFPSVHNPTTGTINIAIACSATKVTVQAKSIQQPEPLNLKQYAILVAKDSNGTILDQAVGTQFDQFELLTVSSPNTPIKTVQLGVEGDGVSSSAQFDDLNVQCVRTFGHVGRWYFAVWRPYWVLTLVVILLAGLVIVTFLRRRSKR